MSVWLHSSVVAATLTAIAIVGMATVAGHEAAPTGINSGVAAPRGDRLQIASAPDANYVTIEKRADGLSVLTRIQTAHE